MGLRIFKFFKSKIASFILSKEYSFFEYSSRKSIFLEDLTETSTEYISKCTKVFLNGNILGVVKFKLFLPETRYGDNEVFVTSVLEKLNFTVPRTSYVNVNVNNFGEKIYIFQEKVVKELLEFNNFREGPILKLSDRNLRNEWLRNEKTSGYVPLSMKNADISIFNMKKSSKNVLQISQFNLASEMLNKYLKKELTSAVYFFMGDLDNELKKKFSYQKGGEIILLEKSVIVEAPSSKSRPLKKFISKSFISKEFISLAGIFSKSSKA